MTSDAPLRRIYSEVCRGYSETTYLGRAAFVKHLTVFDQSEIDTLREEAFNRAAKRGIQTEAAKLKWLADKGLWLPKEDADLAMQRAYVDNLEKTRGKLAIKSQADQMTKQIDEARAKIGRETERRARLIGLTAEQVADQRVQYEYLRLSVHEDRALSRPMFTPSDIDNLSDEEADSLLISYVSVISRFSHDNLRRIVISDFFTRQFYLCGDNIKSFFGRPIVELSMPQVNLLDWGRYFKSILTSNDLPKELLSNPDKIEEYVMRSRNMRAVVDKAGNHDRVALIGATSADLKAAGLEDGSAKVREDIGRQVKNGMQAAKTREVSLNP